jgi:hypothetical protein
VAAAEAVHAIRGIENVDLELRELLEFDERELELDQRDFDFEARELPGTFI